MDSDPTTEDVDELAKMFAFKGGIPLPPKLSELRQKLFRKAKLEPKFRFYVLYDRIYRKDTLESAWLLVRNNNGAPGLDGISIDQIENSEGGPAKLLETIQEELRSKTYRPQGVRRKYIEKSDGKLRPLGIPTVKDRIVQTATLLILEPIFEADFLECSFGYRPGRSAHDALDKVRENLLKGFDSVYDADLKGYFDSIPHDKLLAGLKTRITDRSVLNMIQAWLDAPVVETDEAGKEKASRPGKGTPQGGVISPLLANSFLNWFDRAFHKPEGPAALANARLVRYADDFVVMARYQGAKLVRFVEGFIEGKLGLVINRDKTKIVDLKAGEELSFLGYTFRYESDLYGGDHKYLNAKPSKKALAREREALRELTSSRNCFKPIKEMIGEVNEQIRGWANYFSFGYPSMAYREVNWFVWNRLVTHLQRRSQRPFKPPEGKTFYEHLSDLGLVHL